MKKKEVVKFYSLNKIMSYKAVYNVIYGERPNGKTYSVLKYGIEKYVKHQGQMGIIRRWEVDLKGKNGSVLFDALVANNEISILTQGQWTDVYYYSKRWYFCRYDDETQKREVADEPFAYAFSISNGEHDKSTSYPNINTILFDEFITRGQYLPDEFVAYMNLLSTIIRHRDTVEIFMLANTVNKYCPYFEEMGLKHIKEQKQGTIDLYTYGESNLSVAVEYCSSLNKEGKPSDKYFAFDNPKLHMITGGAWEIDIYPHLPMKYRPQNVKFEYFIKFDDNTLHCEIIKIDRSYFTYIHEKTTSIKDLDRDLIYSPEYDARDNWRRNILHPIDTIDKRVLFFFKHDKVFYQNNEIGEIVRNYLNWCKSY